MPRCIIKVRDKYCVWSTIVDAPVSPFVDTLEVACSSLAGIPMTLSVEGMTRLKETGSTHPYMTADDLVESNRAGEHEACLSVDDLLLNYADIDTETPLRAAVVRGDA